MLRGFSEGSPEEEAFERPRMKPSRVVDRDTEAQLRAPKEHDPEV